MTPKQHLIQGIDTVILRVSNIENAKNWYIEKLGFGLLYEDPASRLAVLDTYGPTSLTLWQTDYTLSVHRDTANYPILKTVQVEALRNELVHRGVETSEISYGDGVSFFQFFDPDGNVLEACQLDAS